MGLLYGYVSFFEVSPDHVSEVVCHVDVVACIHYFFDGVEHLGADSSGDDACVSWGSFSGWCCTHVAHLLLLGY